MLVRAAQAELLEGDPHGSITLLADTETATSNRSYFAKGSPGAPVHFHTSATEMFFVLSGSLQVLNDDEIITLEQGDFLAVPPRTKHAFAPAPGAEADVLCTFTPGMGRFDYYRLLDRVQRGLADPKEIAASSERFDNHYSESALWAAR